MSNSQGGHQWRAHYSGEAGSKGWLARLLGKPAGTKPQRPWPELMHPRRLRESGPLKMPDGSYGHFTGYSSATPEQEAWYRVHRPEEGLHEEDLKAYSQAQRGPVRRFFAALVFWRQ